MIKFKYKIVIVFYELIHDIIDILYLYIIRSISERMSAFFD